MLPDEVHISSLIVQAMPDTMPAVAASVLAMPGLEIHAAAEGKMVVVLETADEGEIVARISEINLLNGVMSVNPMDITKQGARAAWGHQEFLFTGERTCIDCHKGIAHQLPNMEGVQPGWSDAASSKGTLGHWLAQAGE